jgi:hypothetical protein
MICSYLSFFFRMLLSINEFKLSTMTRIYRSFQMIQEDGSLFLLLGVSGIVRVSTRLRWEVGSDDEVKYMLKLEKS